MGFLRSHYTLTTEMDRLAILDTLQRHTAGAVNSAEKYFWGSVLVNGFALSPRPAGRNSWRPVLKGTIRERPGGGCQIEIKAGVHPLSLALTLVWLGLLTFFSVGIWGTIPAMGLRWELLFPVFFWIWGLGLPGLAYGLPEKRMRKRLCALLNAQIV